MRKSLARAATGLLILAALEILFASSAAAQENGPANATCLGCHRIESLSVPTANGDTRQLHVSPDAFEWPGDTMQSCFLQRAADGFGRDQAG